MKICACCAGKFEYPRDIKRYGEYYLCRRCLLEQGHCTVCGKRRYSFNVNGVCIQCSRNTEEIFEYTRTPLVAHTVPTDPTIGPGVTLDNFDNKVLKAPPKIKCMGCGLYERARRFTKTEDGLVCDRCLQEYVKCHLCGKIKRGFSTRCFDCMHKTAYGAEHNWRYKPRKFIKYGSGDILFGIENEVEVKEDKRAYLTNFSKNHHHDVAYTMFDGTIHYGTEVVMHPHSFEKLKAFNFKPMLEGVIKSPTTGMHIHISRTSFTNRLHLYKFMKFVNHNKKFIKFIAGRPSGRDRQWDFADRRILVQKAKGARVDVSKYVDINIQHGETIELRIFKGAVTPKEIISNIEFCHALILFSGKYGPNSAIDVDKYVSFVGSRQDTYSSLNERLKIWEKKQANE